MKQTKQKELEQIEANFLKQRKDILDFWKAGYLDDREANEFLEKALSQFEQTKKGLIHE